MQLRQFYNIATKVSSKKSATTFDDLPDCWVGQLKLCKMCQKDQPLSNTVLYLNTQSTIRGKCASKKSAA